jgi:hypothetical protein
MGIPDCVHFDIEDYLQDHRVFYNMLRGPGNTCDPGSYMSMVDFKEWDACKMDLLNEYGSAAIKQGAESFNAWAYLSPTFRLIALCMEQLLDKYPNHPPIDPDNIGYGATLDRKEKSND